MDGLEKHLNFKKKFFYVCYTTKTNFLAMVMRVGTAFIKHKT
jgi:hypothetical protein